MKTILITAFEPFGGSGRNSSLDTLRSLPEEIGGIRIRKAEIPVEYVRCGEALADAVREIPEGDLSAVLCLGQAEGRGNITPEYLAVNVRHAGIADNAGLLCRYDRIEEDGPAALFATLPAERITERLTERGIPAAPSFSAGTYVCNSLLYAALRLAAPRGIPAGFIHLPLSAEIAEAEGKAGRVNALPQETLTKGIAEAVRVIAEESY